MGLSTAQQRRRQLVFRIVGIVAVLGTAIAVRPAAVADAETSTTDPYRLRQAVDVDPAPTVLETTLVAQPATVDLGGGLSANVWTYNGTVPGPEIRVRVGDTIVVHFENRLPVASSIHWHGIELNNASDGTELTQNAVKPGQRFLYRFTVPRPGIFWYHPHHNATNPVFKGQYGSLIVEDRHDDTLVANGVLPPDEQTRTLLLSDTTVCKDPGTNDTDTYDDSLPWALGGPLPEQPGPSPSTLCDTPMDEHGKKIVDANGRPVPLRKGDIPNIQNQTPLPFGAGGRTNEGQTVLVNGRNPGHRDGSPEAPGQLATGAAVVDVPAGQALRLQAINAATVRYFRLRMTDHDGRHIPLVRVGGEGGLLDEARLEGGVLPSALGVAPFDTEYEQGELVLGASDRADFVVAIPTDAPLGVATLWTLDYSRTGDGYSFIPTVPVMHINVTAPTGDPYTIAPGDDLRTHPSVADPVEALGEPPGLLPGSGSPTTPLLDPRTFTPPKQGSAEEDINLTTSGNATSIDFTRGPHHTGAVDYTAIPHTLTSRYARLGDLLELTVVNRTAANHPFHLHGFSFQPLAFEHTAEVTGTPQRYDYHDFGYREFVDTFDIPADFAMRFRVRLDDRPLLDGSTPGGGLGRWMLHCHIFFHATQGMHTELVIVGPDGNEKPAVDADTTAIAVVKGGAATAAGRYVDPDGNPVTLTASTGQVTDLGGGRWSWQGSAPPADETVFITATDSRGLRGQAAFDIVVDNAPPDVALVDPPSGTAFAVGSPVTVTASALDPNPTDMVVCRFDWDDGLGAGAPVAAVDGRCAQTRTPAHAGIYTVTATASDGDGGTDVDRTVVAVYDPAAGSVTGSGAMASPPGAYVGAPASSGPATFDLVAKYKDRTGKPSGSLAFVYAIGPFELRATGYDWLVVAGAKAQARGTATVGGVAGHRFLLSVSDGPDGFRLQVWDAAGASVYDNLRGAPDDLDAFDPPPITAGSVVVHY